MVGVFITGTDTGVGKTLIAGALIRVFSSFGPRTGGMKPVETGCSRQGDALIPEDGMFLKTIARMEEPITQIVPYTFEPPVSPMTAAEMSGGSIDPLRIKREFYELKRRYDFMVVEGAGGLLAPMGQDYFSLDIPRDLGLPLIVVARPGLGTINHTLLTVRYAISNGLTVAGVIINHVMPPQGTLAEETNPSALKSLLPVPLIGSMPYLGDHSPEALEKAAFKNLDADILKRLLI